MEYTYRSKTTSLCPIYAGTLHVSIDKTQFALSSKQNCVILSRELISKSVMLLTDENALKSINSFSCGGCKNGVVHFERDSPLNENDQKILNLLKVLPFFSTISENDCRKFIENFDLRIFRENDYIIHEGENSPRFYIILKGSGRISKANCKFVKITSGEVIGEISYLLGLIPTNSVQSLEDTYTLSITKEKLKELTRNEEIVREYLMFVLTHRLRRLIEFSRLNGLSGHFSEIPIYDVLQTLNTAGKTGLLEVHLEKFDVYVLLRDGMIVQIEYGPITGKDAFKLLVKNAKFGTFSFSSGEVDQDLKPISETFHGLLLEALQNADESS